MTDFASPFNVLLPYVDTTVATIDVSGTASMSLDGLTLTGITVDTASTADTGASAGDVPVSAVQGWAQISVNGTTYVMPLFKPAT